MKNQKRLLSCPASLVAAIVLVVISISFLNAQGQTEEGAKQDHGQSQGGGSGGGGGFGLGFGGGSGGGGGGGGAFPADFIGSSPAIAVEGKYVFVVHNNTLYQFAADDLTTINSVPLEAVD